MITKTANLFILKQAGAGDDAMYWLRDKVGANDMGDHISHYAGKAGEAISDLFGGLKKNVDNTINGGHDGGVSDRAKQLLSHLSAKAKEVGVRARRAAHAAANAYNLDER